MQRRMTMLAVLAITGQLGRVSGDTHFAWAIRSQHLSLFGAFQGSTGTPFCDLLCGMNNNIPARLSLWLPPINLSNAEIRACSRMKKT